MPPKAGFRLQNNTKSTSKTYSFNKLKSAKMENKNQGSEGQGRLNFTRRNFIVKTIMSMAGLALTPLFFASANPDTKINGFSNNGLFLNKDKKKAVLLLNAHLKYAGLSE